jgi:hypothetical protein
MALEPRALKTLTDQEVDLAIKWARQEIGYSDVAETLGKKWGTATYAFLARALKAAVLRGKLKSIE